MPEESLRAQILGSESLSGPMRDVADSVRDVADAARDTSGALSGLTGAMGSAESGAEDLAGALNDVSASAVGASGSLERAEESAEDAGDQAAASALEFGTLATALHALPERTGVDVDVNFDRDALQSTLSTLTADRGIDIAVPESVQTRVQASGSVELEADTDVLDGLRDSLGALPNTVTTHIETTANTGAIARTQTALAGLPDTTTARVNTTFDGSQLAAIRGALGALDGEQATVGVSLTGASRVRGQLRALRASLTDATATFDTVVDVERGPVAGLRESLADLPDAVSTHIETTADTSAIGRVQTGLASIPDRTVTHIKTTFERDQIPSLNVLSGQRTIETAVEAPDDIQTQFDAVAEASVDIDGLADAHADLAALRGELTELDGTTATVGVDIDADSLDDVSRTASTAVEVDTDGMEEARLAADGLGDALNDLPVIGSLGLGDTANDIAQVQSALGDLPDGLGLGSSVSTVDALATSLRDAEADATSALRQLSALEDVSIDGDTISVNALVEGADSIADLRESLASGGAEAQQAARGLDAVGDAGEDLLSTAIADAASVDELDDQLEELGTGAVATAGALEGLGDSAGDLLDEAIASAGSVNVLAGRVDELGDEASESARELFGLASAMGATSAASGLSANIGGLSGNISTLAKLAPIAAAGIASIGSAAAGAGIGGAGLAGVGGLLTGAGAISIGESIAAEDPQDDIENASDGVEEFFARVKEQASGILDPLKTQANRDLFTGLIGAGLGALQDAVTLTQRLSDEFHGMADTIGGVWDAVSPEVFAELESAARSVLPALENLSVDVLSGLPGFIAFAVEEFEQLAPLVDDVVDVFADLAGPLSELGTAGLSVILVALEGIGYALQGLIPYVDILVPAFEGLANVGSELLDTFGPALTALGTIVAGVFAGVKIAGLASALSGLVGVLGSVVAAAGGASGILSGLAAAVGALTFPISGTVLAVGALTGAIIAVVDYFELWDDTINVLTTGFNYLVELSEFAANIFSILGQAALWAADGIIDFLTPFESGGAVLSAFGSWLQWVGQEVKQLAQVAWRYLGPVAKAIEKVDNKLGKQGGVSYDQYKVDSDDGGGDGTPPSAIPKSTQSLPGASSGRGGSGPPGASSSSQTVYEGDTVVEVDARGGGASEARIQRAVEEAIQQSNKESRRRGSPMN